VLRASYFGGTKTNLVSVNNLLQNDISIFEARSTKHEVRNPMFIVIEENKNCSPDERVFSESGEKKLVSQVFVNNAEGNPVWCDVVAVFDNGSFGEVHAIRVEDSSDGTAWLIQGGEWGIRFRPVTIHEDWNLESKNQWGAPFKVLDQSGTAIRFKL